ncbi:MAG TPA: serine hydrolase domain-containing protein [Thermoanaerobaculia bacterium]|nr:serine hydrolase domain-containing protein [Thermoanaerobaculia bacterium]
MPDPHFPSAQTSTVRHVSSFLFVVLVVFSILGCRTTSAPVSARLDTLFFDLHTRGLFDGAVVVSDERGIVFEKGYGFANVEARAPFTADTAADGASLAKTFTAALLLELDAEGVLSLDDPAQKLLPELPYPDITLRDLLRHTSGLLTTNYEWFDDFLPKDEVRTTEALLRVIAQQKPALRAKPGTEFEYSSFAYDVALLAASRAARTPSVELLAERFFRPLGMSSAFARPGHFRDFPVPRTLGYTRSNGTLVLHDVFNLEGFHGGSNLYISARDLDRWNRSFFDTRILSPNARSEGQRFASIGGAASGLTWGSWYRTKKATAFWYSGHLEGFHDEVFRDAITGHSIVYVSNNTIEPWLWKGIVRAVRGILKGEHASTLTEPAIRRVSKEERPLLAGEWTFNGGERVTIDAEDTSLFLTREGVRYRVFQIDARWFYAPGIDWILGLVDSTANGVGSLYRSANDGEAWASRASATP